MVSNHGGWFLRSLWKRQYLEMVVAAITAVVVAVTATADHLQTNVDLFLVGVSFQHTQCRGFDVHSDIVLAQGLNQKTSSRRSGQFMDHQQVRWPTDDRNIP